jgi:histidine triad (HIT) family protein
MNKDCVFCQIITKKEPARIVHWDDDTIAFFPGVMNVKGHIIVASVEHYTDLFQIQGDVLSSLMNTTQLLAEHCKRQLGADGINLLHASCEAAQQSVPHFHIHLLPRFKDDNLDTWPRLPEWNGDLDELLMELKVHEKGT